MKIHGLEVRIRTMPRPRREPTVRQQDREKALGMVLQAIQESIARCEALEQDIAAEKARAVTA